MRAPEVSTTSFGAVPGVATQDAIILSNATLNVNGPSLSLDAKQGITLGSGTGGLSAATGVTLTIPGVIAGTNALRTGTGVTSQGGDYIHLSGANTFSGNIRFLASNTYLDNVNALQYATLDCNTADDGGVTVTVPSVTLGGVMGGRGWRLRGLSDVNIGNNNQNTTWSGTLIFRGGRTDAEQDRHRHADALRVKTALRRHHRQFRHARAHHRVHAAQFPQSHHCRECYLGRFGYDRRADSRERADPQSQRLRRFRGHYQRDGQWSDAGGDQPATVHRL